MSVTIVFNTQVRPSSCLVFILPQYRHSACSKQVRMCPNLESQWNSGVAIPSASYFFSSAKFSIKSSLRAFSGFENDEIFFYLNHKFGIKIWFHSLICKIFIILAI